MLVNIQGASTATQLLISAESIRRGLEEAPSAKDLAKIGANHNIDPTNAIAMGVVALFTYVPGCEEAAQQKIDSEAELVNHKTLQLTDVYLAINKILKKPTYSENRMVGSVNLVDKDYHLSIWGVEVKYNARANVRFNGETVLIKMSLEELQKKTTIFAQSQSVPGTEI